MTHKRVYVPKAVYHVTLNPKYRLPYFTEDVFCYILANVLREGQQRKDYYLVGYKINPDHVHLLIQCGTRFNISEILHHIKRVSSIQMNMVRSKGTESERKDYEWSAELLCYYHQLILKYGGIDNLPYALFYWQPGFNDVLIRSPSHLQRAIAYLRRQAEIHELLEMRHFFIAGEMPADVRYLHSSPDIRPR